MTVPWRRGVELEQEKEDRRVADERSDILVKRLDALQAENRALRVEIAGLRERLEGVHPMVGRPVSCRCGHTWAWHDLARPHRCVKPGCLCLGLDELAP